MQQSIHGDALGALEQRLTAFLRSYPTSKAQLLDSIGHKMLARVRENIRASGMKNSAGRLPGFQEYYVGSRRGYTAVRAKGGHTGERSESPGALTNYTENGHRVRRPKQTARRRYVPRATQARVRAYYYYNKTEAAAEAMAAEELHSFAADIAQQLGGTP